MEDWVNCRVVLPRNVRFFDEEVTMGGIQPINKDEMKIIPRDINAIRPCKGKPMEFMISPYGMAPTLDLCDRQNFAYCSLTASFMH